MVCDIDVDRYKQYSSPIESGMPGGRKLKKSKRKEQQQIMIGMKTKEQ